MSTEINDRDTKEQISRLIEDIPRNAERLLETAQRDVDTSVNPDWPAEVDQMVAELPSLVDRLVRRAEQYLEGNASTFDTMLELLEPAWHHVEDLQETLDACQTELQDWSEEPVSGISLEYLRDLKQASELQRSWLEEMGRAVEGYRDLLTETRHRAFLIFEAVDHALRYQGVPGRGGHFSWPDLFQVVGIVVSAITLNPIPAAGARALKVVAFLAQVGGAIATEPKTAHEKHVELEGSGSLSNPIPTLVDALDRLTQLGQSVHEAETETFSEGYRKDIDGTNERGGLYHDPWRVAERDNAPAIPAGEVAVNIAKLYRVAVEMLPAAAYGYQQAAQELESLMDLENTAFGSAQSAYSAVIGYSRHEFEEFRAAILDCFQRTRDDLLDVGSRLEQIAQNHRAAQDNATQILERMHQYVADIDTSYTTVAEAEASEALPRRPTMEDRLGPGG